MFLLISFDSISIILYTSLYRMWFFSVLLSNSASFSAFLTSPKSSSCFSRSSNLITSFLALARAIQQYRRSQERVSVYLLLTSLYNEQTERGQFYYLFRIFLSIRKIYLRIDKKQCHIPRQCGIVGCRHLFLFFTFFFYLFS